VADGDQWMTETALKHGVGAKWMTETVLEHGVGGNFLAFESVVDISETWMKLW
jgi:hypothetical protein